MLFFLTEEIKNNRDQEWERMHYRESTENSSLRKWSSKLRLEEEKDLVVNEKTRGKHLLGR